MAKISNSYGRTKLKSQLFVNKMFNRNRIECAKLNY